MAGLLQEMKRRNVVRVGVAYIIVGWVVVQIGQLLFESFGTPDWVIKTVIVLIGLGFPFALLFAWAFELTPDGLKKTREVDVTSSITPKTGQKLNYVIIASLVGFGAGMQVHYASGSDKAMKWTISPFLPQSQKPRNSRLQMKQWKPKPSGARLQSCPSSTCHQTLSRNISRTDSLKKY